MTIVNKNPEYFLTIAAEQSVSKAAEKLFVSQSYLSQHIAKLEAQLGVKLFDRTKTPIKLTEAGRIYASYLESCSRLYQKLAVDLDNLNHNREQTLAIGFSGWRGSTLLPDILPRFTEENPHVKLVLHERPISEMYGLINAGTVDFVIMNTNLTTPETVTTETLAYEKILLVGNKHNPAAQKLAEAGAAGQGVDWKLLENERFLLLAPELTLGRRVENYLDKMQVVLHNVTVSTNASTCLALVAENMGFCFLNESGFSRAPNRQDLIFFDLNTTDLTQPLNVVYKKDSYLSPVARSFIETTRSYYEKELWRSSDPEGVILSVGRNL